MVELQRVMTLTLYCIIEHPDLVRRSMVSRGDVGNGLCLLDSRYVEAVIS